MRPEKYYKSALNRLKEKRGPVDEKLLERNKHRNRLVRAVSKAITDKKLHTVPEIRTILHFESSEIFYAINFLMKYQGLKITNKRGEYPTYDFVEAH